MTPRKTRKIIGRRPSSDEALQGWWRISDSPAGRLRPDSLSTPRDMPCIGDAFDLYCFQIVNKTFEQLSVRDRCPVDLMERVVRHFMQNCPSTEQMGKYPQLFRRACESFQLYKIVDHDRDGNVIPRPLPRPVSEADRLGLTAADQVATSYRKFLSALGRTINEAEPFVSVEVELAS